jgi:hypothetical protein
MKNEIKYIENALTKILKLKPCNYIFKDDKLKSVQSGFLLDEMSDDIKGANIDNKYMNYIAFIPYIIKAIQEIT